MLLMMVACVSQIPTQTELEYQIVSFAAGLALAYLYRLVDDVELPDIANQLTSDAHTELTDAIEKNKTPDE